MYGKFLKWHISQLVAPIEVLFVASPLGFGGLHDDINIFAVRQSYLKLLKKQWPQTQCVPTIDGNNKDWYQITAKFTDHMKAPYLSTL